MRSGYSSVASDGRGAGNSEMFSRNVVQPLPVPGVCAGKTKIHMGRSLWATWD